VEAPQRRSPVAFSRVLPLVLSERLSWVGRRYSPSLSVPRLRW
jgi:hypothetical protein